MRGFFLNLEEIDINSNVDFVNDLRDLIIDHKKNHEHTHLEAFKSLLNDQIIIEGNESKYAQLKRVSIGYPMLVY
jgi:hypothetical protein